jgi:hypothetical protein
MATKGSGLLPSERTVDACGVPQTAREVFSKDVSGSDQRAAWGGNHGALSAFQAAPTKTIIAENSIHTINPIAAASPP